MGSLSCCWDQSLPSGICLFLVESQSWQQGRTNFPVGWEALEQFLDSRDVAADGCDALAIHALWTCVLGDAGLGCSPCCRLQAGPDLPVGGRCLCWPCIMNKNDSKQLFGFETTHLLVASLSKMGMAGWKLGVRQALRNSTCLGAKGESCLCANAG